MNKVPPSFPLQHDTTLNELVALGMRVGRVVARLTEMEQAAAEVSAAWLPEVGVDAGSLTEAQAAGQAVDAVGAALTLAVPRVDLLARAFERVARSVRRSVALQARLAAGWPRVGRDDRAAMVRRQVARGVEEAIRRERDGEAAERLFDELAMRLDDPALDDELVAGPVDEVVRRICRDLGLAAEAIRPGVERTTVLSRGSGQSPDASGVDSG